MDKEDMIIRSLFFLVSTQGLSQYDANGEEEREHIMKELRKCQEVAKGVKNENNN